MKMKLLFILEFIFLITGIRGEPNPRLILIPRQTPQLSDNFGQINDNNIQTKTVAFSDANDLLDRKDAPNIVRVVMNAVHKQLNQDVDNNVTKELNNSDIPEVVFANPEQTAEKSGIRLFKKVYKFPAMTRMISKEEESDNNDNKETGPFGVNQFWRSPIPMMHNDCPYMKINKKLKLIGRKQNNNLMATAAEPTTTIRPVTENSESNAEPLGSLLSLLSNSLSAPESESVNNNEDEVRDPTAAFLMSITHRSEPDLPSELSLSSKPNEAPLSEMPSFLTLLRKKMELQPQPEPELPSISPFNPFLAILHQKLELQPQPELPVIPPFNPFLSLLTQIHKQIIPKPDIDLNEIQSKPIKEDKRDNGKVVNFNFNVNFTINNNNNEKPVDRPHIRPNFPFLL